MSDDTVLTVRQISQYPAADATSNADRWLLQQGGLGGPYRSIVPSLAVGTALEQGGYLKLAPGSGLAWNGAQLIWENGLFAFSEPVAAPVIEAGEIFSGGFAVALQPFVEEQLAALNANVVHSFNGRRGTIILDENDIRRAGGVTQNNPTHFTGMVTAPTPWDFRANSDQVATTAWVQGVIGALMCSGSIVTSFNGRGGEVTLTPDDITAAASVPGQYARASNPPLGDASSRIATTFFVDETAQYIVTTLRDEIANDAAAQLVGYAPLDSPAFTGLPTAPTAAPGNSTGQLATTAFVQAAVTAATTGVSSFNTRTGAVTLASGDITAAGGALLVSPAFTGTPTGPTAAPGDDSTKIATTAFVHAAVAAISAGVTTFNSRSGAVTLTVADITGAGGAPIASPALTGTPTAPTVTAGDNSTKIATTAFVAGAVAASTAGVSSFNGRTGAVNLQANDISAAGGAPAASPALTGIPTAPTAAPGTSTTQLATTAFVMAQLAAGGVISFNGRSGAVTLQSSDISTAGGAVLASPAFSGTPTAPNAAPGTNNTQIATTAFVMSALGGSVVSTFNGRSGAVTLTTADVTGAGGAPTASPAFTGSPSAPTPAPGNSSTLLATTAFVAAAVAGAVTAFNGRSGSVTLAAADISAAGGALLAGPALTGTPTAPTATTGTATNQIATCQFVLNELGTLGGVTTWNGRAGTVTLTAADVTGVGGALLAGPAFTGAPTAPTAAPGTNTTQLATTAFVAAAIAGYAPLASPAFTGTPTVPTASPGTNTTQAASTAFVAAAMAAGPAVSGARVLLSSTTISTAVASVDMFGNWSATYDMLELVTYDLICATADTPVIVRISLDGSTFDAGANYFNGWGLGTYSSGGGGSNTGAVLSGWYVSTSVTALSAHPNQCTMKIRLGAVGGAGPSVTALAATWNSNTLAGMFLGGAYSPSPIATPVQGLRVIPTTGNLTRGVVKLYGIVK